MFPKTCSHVEFVVSLVDYDMSFKRVWWHLLSVLTQCLCWLTMDSDTTVNTTLLTFFPLKNKVSVHGFVTALRHSPTTDERLQEADCASATAALILQQLQSPWMARTSLTRRLI